MVTVIHQCPKTNFLFMSLEYTKHPTIETIPRIPWTSSRDQMRSVSQYGRAALEIRESQSMNPNTCWSSRKMTRMIRIQDLGLNLHVLLIDWY